VHSPFDFLAEESCPPRLVTHIAAHKPPARDDLHPLGREQLSRGVLEVGLDDEEALGRVGVLAK